MHGPLTTPVAFFVFNRPTPTLRVWERIAAARPRTLLLVADGPRGPEEAGRCDVVRRIVERIDWPCDVRRNYSAINLGCRRRMSSGIDWVFNQVPEAIVLEDDCLPEATFFAYCEDLLRRYRDDPRIMLISGDNFQDGIVRTPFSYYFSAIPHIWGWATWRRAWAKYDLHLSGWSRLRETPWLGEVLADESAARSHARMIDLAAAGQLDTWDVQWAYSVWCHGGLSILPERNLITNIGFGDDATHTHNPADTNAGIASQAMSFPLNHPPAVTRNLEADLYFFHRPARRASAHRAA